MNHKHEEFYYWCSDCKDYGFFDPIGDPKKNDFYRTNAGRVDGVCKMHRLLRNAKYRAPKKGKRSKKVKQEKDLGQIYKEIGRSKLSGCDRGNIKFFKKYWAQRPEYFKDIYHVNYSEQAAEQEFNNLIGEIKWSHKFFYQQTNIYGRRKSLND